MRSIAVFFLSMSLLAGCSLLSRVSKDSDVRMTGTLEIVIETSPNPPWKGGTLEAIIDFDSGTWWQEWWSREGISPCPLRYTLDGTKLEMTLISEGSVEMSPFPLTQGEFVISMSGTFRKMKKRKGYLLGPLRGTGKGLELIQNESGFGPVRYNTKRTIWSGRIIGYPYDGVNRTEVIHFIRPR
ncbi:hypothetical protein ACFL41_01225 [Gemmatimonadota bacterium]